MMKHCIVTPDVIGPVKNGGIGTHCHWFARLLAETGRQVTILFTGPIIEGSERTWRDFYAGLGIEFVWLNTACARSYPVRAFETQQRSFDVFRYLDRNKFDVIHFQEWQGNGLQTLQARRTTGAFETSSITVTMHSSTRWIAEGGQHWYKRPLENAMTNWAEMFMARNADVVFSPSQYMIEWVRENGWTLTQDVKVIPVCSEVTEMPESPTATEAGVLAFFGRLETRKGLELFLKALDRLSVEDRAKIRNIYFVGRVGQVRNENAATVIRRTMSTLAVSYEIHSDLSSEQAVAFLADRRANIFIPSLSDNYPLVAVEAAGRGLAVHAARVGGLPEIFGPSHLFDPTPLALSERLSSVLNGTPAPFDVRHNASLVRAKWLDAVQDAEASGVARSVAQPKPTAKEPLVSICVPYYNYPDYLPKLIGSFKALSYHNFEVIIVDDGSPDPRAIEVFDSMKASITDSRYRFERHENAGVGAARNAAAKFAQGEYLIFMDSDNLAKPEMLQVFINAMERTNAEIAVCYFDAFDERCEPTGEAHIHHVYAPAGPCLEVAWAENVMGDANFCIRRTVFDSLGGFGTERDSSWEDWEFLLRGKLAGKKIEVIPKSLFWYRYTEAGFSRNTEKYKNQRRVLRPFLEASQESMVPVIEVMRQVTLNGLADGNRTPAGAIAGAIADRIYRKLGSPSGKYAQAVETLFKRLMR